MKRIKSLMGRRQFLFAAGVASTIGIGYQKIAGAFGPGNRTGAAMASESSGGSAKEGRFSSRYRHILSPLKVGNAILKNRMLHTRSIPHFFQGPETFPSEQVISHYANVAKSAAVVTCRAPRIPMRDRATLRGDSAHMGEWNVEDPSVQNYFSQLADAIHFYDAKASIGIHIYEPEGYNISTVPISSQMTREPSGKEAPIELLQEMIDRAVKDISLFQSLGYDMVNIYMSYRAHLLAHALAPGLNKRTDKYGGSIENRARLPLELFQAIKKACGPDFLIEAQISGEDTDEDGYSMEDMVEYAKIWEDSIDILQLRAGGKGGLLAHPMGWNSEKGKPLTLQYAEALKKSGVKVITAPVGGFQDLDLNEAFIAGGKTDMVAMARAFICDSEYSEKIYEGRGEDVVPCIRCNKCHGDTTWLNFCSVNPEIGVAHRLNRMVAPPGSPQKVAVIGGGPAGMRAAVIAAERGHKVTLYEKNGYLGGLLHHTDFAAFQWPLKDFKDYLVRQLEKTGVEVKLNTEATPEMIQGKGYNAVMLALGSEPIIPRIPGADAGHVWDVVNVFGNEKSLGKRVVVIGGGRGAETALHLAQRGHEVTLLASGKEVAPRGGPHQGISYDRINAFDVILQAIPKRITSGEVIYTDAEGREKSIPADSVVIFGGLRPRQEEALKFSGAADRFFIIGDCTGRAGNLQKCNRIAFAAASQI